MENAILDLPLALFTTLAPIGAGGFIALAIAFFTTKFTDEQLRKINKLSFVPFGFVALGFIASFFHLGSPFNAANVFSGLGRSPLSNEVAVGLIFVLLALVYCIIAAMGKLSEGSRKGFSAVVAVVGLVFAVFTGMAYMVGTIPSWSTPLAPLEVLGFCLLGGALLGSFVLAWAGSLADAKKTGYKTATLVLAIAGAVIAIGALLAHVGMVGSMSSTITTGAALVSEVTLWLVLCIIGMAVALFLEWRVLFKKGTVGLTGINVAIIVIAVFIARLIFYALKLSVGL